MVVSSLRFLASVIVLVCLSPAEASAKFILVTWGETVDQIGRVSAQAKPPRGADVLYKYSYYGLFWIDLWTHDGTYCLYDGVRCDSISAAEAAKLLGKQEREMTTPFLYRWPLGWLILAPTLLILLLWGVISEVSNAAPLPAAPVSPTQLLPRPIREDTPKKRDEAPSCYLCGTPLAAHELAARVCGLCSTETPKQT